MSLSVCFNISSVFVDVGFLVRIFGWFRVFGLRVLNGFQGLLVVFQLILSGFSCFGNGKTHLFCSKDSRLKC